MHDSNFYVEVLLITEMKHKQRAKKDTFNCWLSYNVLYFDRWVFVLHFFLTQSVQMSAPGSSSVSVCIYRLAEHQPSRLFPSIADLSRRRWADGCWPTGLPSARQTAWRSNTSPRIGFGGRMSHTLLASSVQLHCLSVTSKSQEYLPEMHRAGDEVCSLYQCILSLVLINT